MTDHTHILINQTLSLFSVCILFLFLWNSFQERAHVYLRLITWRIKIKKAQWQASPNCIFFYPLRIGGLTCSAELPIMVTINVLDVQRLVTQVLLFVRSCPGHKLQKNLWRFVFFLTLAWKPKSMQVWNRGQTRTTCLGEAVQLYKISIIHPLPLRT